jgi:hypothetical protein
MSLLKQNPVKLVESSFKEEETDAALFSKELENEIQKIFPKSNIKVIPKNILGDLDVMVYFTLGKNESEYVNKISKNDPAYHILSISGAEKTGEILKPLTLDVDQGAGFMINPPEGSHLAMDRIKVPFRKATGDKNKIKKALVDYFIKLKTELKKNVDNIYQSGSNNIDYASKL